jgi:hypothetical protein
MSILDNLANTAQNQWLSEKLEDNPEEEQALQTTARIASAHIWSFLASAISPEDYQARRNIKRDEVLYICGTIAPHLASGLTDYVLSSFDVDFVKQGARDFKAEPFEDPEEAQPEPGQGDTEPDSWDQGPARLSHRPKMAQEELGVLTDLLPALMSAPGQGANEGGNPDQEPGMASTPKVEHLVREAPGGGVHGPYYIREVGGGYDVVNAQGESKGHHSTREEALAQQRALYVHVPKAREQAESREGKAPPKAVQEVGSPGSEEQREHEGSLRVANTQEELAAALAGHLRDRHHYGVSSDPADLPWMNQLHDDDHELNADLMDHTHRPRTAAQRHLAQGDPYSATTLLPNVDDDKKEKDDERPEPVKVAPHMPKPWETPKVDQEYEDPSTYYGIWGAGGQQMAKAAVLRVDRYGRISQIEPRRPVIAVLDGYGHIGVSRLPLYGPQGTYNPARDPGREDPDPDREISEAENRGPESDVYFGHEEPHYEADWDRPQYGEYRGGAKERNPRTSAREQDDEEDEEEAAARGRHRRPTKEEEEEEKKEKGEHHRKPPGAPRAGQSKPKPSAGRQTHRPGRAPQRHKTKTSTAKKPRPRAYSDMTPHAQLVHLIEDHPNPESWSWSMYPTDQREDMHKRMHLIPEGADHSHQWPVGSRPDREAHLVREEAGYDPSEAFPGYYGTVQSAPGGSVVLGTTWMGNGTSGAYPAPQTASWTVQVPHTAQAPLTGNSDVPQDPESTTGASGGFDPGGSLNVATPGGTVDTDFNQQDQPQDIQAQLGQVPTLSHKIGAKLAEMATEVLAHNPYLTAVAAMELSLKALRLYPKVASGGADYLAEPGTEGVPTEVLTDCPQCQRQAYNRGINRCHNCGFWDTGIEPTIEIR